MSKLLYITVPSFFDLEISLIRELSKLIDVKVMLIVSPTAMRGSAFSIDKLESETRIYRGLEYSPIKKYSNLVDLGRWYILNNADNSISSVFTLGRMVNRFIKENKVDIIHCTSFGKTATGMLPFLMKHKHKLLTVHDPVPHEKKSWRTHFLHALTIKLYKNILLLADTQVKEFIKMFHVNAKNIHYSRLSVYDFLKTYDLSTNPYGKYILFFGRIECYKGVDMLIDAYITSKAKSEGIKLVIAGKGKIETCYPYQRDDHIVVLNRYIENDELASLISNSMFVALPYRSATQSGVLMSAYAFPKAVLATDTGNNAEYIQNGKNGILIKPNSVEECTRGINEMLDSDISIFERNIEANYLGHGKYSWEYIAKELVETYHAILSN